MRRAVADRHTVAGKDPWGHDEEWAEAFHHIGPRPGALERYIERHAVRLTP